MRVLFLLLILLLLQACTSDYTGGTSSTDNPKIVGYVVDVHRQPVANAEVLVLPVHFNPLVDEMTLLDTTDSHGRFDIVGSETGGFNILARDPSRAALERGVILQKGEQLLDTLVLDTTGALQIILPSSVVTTNSFAYVEGTPYYEDLTTAILDSNTKKAVLLHSLPYGFIPDIMHWSSGSVSSEVLVSDSLEIISGDTLIHNLDSLSKPTWNFPCIVGITQNTVDHYGGLEFVAESIATQFTAVNHNFNLAGQFDANFSFRADSLYVITGDINDQGIKPPAPYVLRILYDGYKEGSLGSVNSFEDSWIHHSHGVSEDDGMFGQISLNKLIWLLGLSRGAKPLDDVHVLAANNPFDNTGYTGAASMMSDPKALAPWDSYNINLLNHYKDSVTFQDIKSSAFPTSIALKIEDSAGDPIENVAVKVYGVVIDQGTIDTNLVLLSGNTSTEGEFQFSKTPYLNDSKDRFLYDNILISLSKDVQRTFVWMPFYEPANHWFENNSTTYIKSVIFP